MDGTVYDFADTPATPGPDTNNYFGYPYIWAGEPFTAGDTFDVAIGSKVPIPSSDATLSALGLSAGTLKPAFAADTTTYTASVANSAASVTVTATKNHADATDPVIKKGATEYADGTVPLDVGDNAITVEVTAEDGVSTQTYTVTVTRAEASAAPRLETLGVANAAGGAALTLTPVFAADTMEYNGSPAYPVSLVTVTATAASGTTVAFEDGAGAALTDADGATGFQAALVPGENVIKVKVTKSGASAYYTLTLTRAKPQVSITAVTASPATEGAALVFRVSRSAAAADTLAVTVSVGEDGAMVDDALETSSAVTIAANQTSADLTVQTDADDATWEEHSTVTASTEPGDLYVQAQPAMAQIEVRDDDFPAATASLSVAETVAEDAGTLDYAVLVETAGDTQPHRSASITVNSRSGTATSADFGFVRRDLALPQSSFVRLSSGVWISRTRLSTAIVDDAVHELDERFELRLERSPNTPAGLGLGTAAVVTVTILDDDTPMLLVSNVRQGPEADQRAANVEVGQGFTTGANEDGYTLGSVGLYLPSALGGAALTVSLRAADGANPSTTVLHALTNPQTFAVGTNYFAAPANTVLTKDTTYFVVVSGSAAFDLGLVASDGEDSGSAAGWSIADRARAVQSGAWAEHSTDDNLAVSVRGEEFVSNDATLSALGLSAGTLKPPFAAGTTTYTADVENSVAGVTVTATKNHADATTVIKLGGVVDADGTVALAEGANVITVEVTAEDGVTTETYTVTVTRAATADSTGTAGSSITVVIETIISGKKVTVSWTDGGTCATTSSYNVYLTAVDVTYPAGITVTPAEGTSSYSKAKDFTTFGADGVQLWCGTPASGRLVAKVDGLNEGAVGTYTHSVPSSDTTAPAPTIELADTTDFRLLISFGETVTGFEESDVALSEHWSLKAGSLTADAQMAGRYTVGFEADRDIGGLKRDLTATIAAGAATDAASNPSLEASLEVEELFAGPAVFVRYSPYITETYQACETPEDGGTEVCEERTREVYAPDADAGDFRVLITFLNSHIEGRPVTGFHD